MRKLRIAQLSPIAERVPPKKYGGTERVVNDLCNELVGRGHDVTLFASGDSQTDAKLISVYPRAIREAKVQDIYGTNPWSLLNIGRAYQKQDEFDIIHDHNGILSVATANMAEKPVVMTIHSAISSVDKRLYESLPRPNLVSISHAQQVPAPDLNYAGSVYNGLDMQDYPFSETNDGYLLFVGRISMQKGLHHAIEVSQFLNLPLIIAAKLESVDIGYFKEYIEPKLSDDSIKWVGEVDSNMRNDLMSRALCLLHPVTWREPFGLTMIEAMATGCPVVAFKKGSIPEIVIDQKTGFVVEDVEEMIDAVVSIDRIQRKDCRTYSLGQFNAKRMTDEYEDIYYDLVRKSEAKDNYLFRQNPLRLNTL